MLGRWLGRFKKVIVLPQHVWFASRKRGGRSIPPGLEAEQATPEETRELREEQKRDDREKFMKKVQPRAFRQPDEQMQREIFRLMDEGKSDKQIIEKLSNKQAGSRPAKKSRAELREEKRLQSMIPPELDDLGAMSEQEELVYQQKAMIQEMKKEVSIKNHRPINKRIQLSDDAEASMAKEFVKRQRTLDIISQRKDPSEYQPPTDSDVDKLLVPDQVIQKAKRYKNKQLQYFAELIQDRRADDGHMLNRRYWDKEGKIATNPKETQLKEKGPYPVTIESEETKKQRLLKQFEQISSPVESDRQFQGQGSSDLQISNSQSSIFLSQDEKRVIKEDDRKHNSHNRQLQKVTAYYNELKKKNIESSLEQHIEMSKIALMEEKHELEEKEQFYQRKHRREKLEEIKKTQMRMNKEKLSDRIDYKASDDIQGFNLGKHKDAFGQPNIEKLTQVNEKYARSIFNGNKEEIDHMYIRTIKNMENWIHYQMTAVDAVTEVFHQIDVAEIVPNDKLTVLNVMWRLRPNFTEGQMDFSRYFEEKRYGKLTEEENKKVDFIQKILEKTAQTMSVRMCQQLKLRFGPNIRFKYYKSSMEYQSSRQKLLRDMPGVIKEKVKQQIEKGVLPKNMKTEDLEKVVRDLEDEFQAKVGNIEDPEHPMAKKEKQTHRQKHLKNRTPDGRKKKSQKKRTPAAERFWQGL